MDNSQDQLRPSISTHSSQRREAEPQRTRENTRTSGAAVLTGIEGYMRNGVGNDAALLLVCAGAGEDAAELAMSECSVAAAGGEEN